MRVRRRCEVEGAEAPGQASVELQAADGRTEKQLLPYHIRSVFNMFNVLSCTEADIVWSWSHIL